MDDLMPTRMKMKDYNEIFTDFYIFKKMQYLFIPGYLFTYSSLVFPFLPLLFLLHLMNFLVVVVISLNPLKWYMTLEVDGLFGGRGFFEAVKPDVLCKFCVHT